MLSTHSPEKTIVGQAVAGILLNGLNELLVNGVRHGREPGSTRISARQVR